MIVEVILLFILALLQQHGISCQDINSNEVPINRWHQVDTHLSCDKTHWLHVPKTGSTFCLSLQHVCCKKRFLTLVEGVTIAALQHSMTLPIKDRTFSYKSSYCYKFERRDLPAGDNHLKCSFAGPVEHLPMKWTANEQRLVMARNPRDRIISAFLDGMHHDGMKMSEWSSLEATIRQINPSSDPKNYSHWLKRAQVYADHPAMKGCQMKMILGHGCASNNTLPIDFEHQLQQRLRSFFFVGIFEEFERSLRLFHALANAATEPSAVERFPQRVQKNRYVKNMLMQDLQFEDPYDDKFYEIAQSVFQEQLQFVQQWKNITL